jgi:hypothetical protein
MEINFAFQGRLYGWLPINLGNYIFSDKANFKVFISANRFQIDYHFTNGLNRLKWFE